MTRAISGERVCSRLQTPRLFPSIALDQHLVHAERCRVSFHESTKARFPSLERGLYWSPLSVTTGRGFPLGPLLERAIAFFRFDELDSVVLGRARPVD